MYRIWIGDDDRTFLQEAIRQVETILARDGLRREEDYTFHCHTSPASLRRAVLADPEQCQFLLLDMEFEDENGIELAKELREGGMDGPLVYLTRYRDYVFDCFATRPEDYLIKPPDWEKLTGLIRRDFRERYAAARLNLKIQGRQVSLRFGEIYALEAYAHHVRLWLKEERIEWNGSLSALEPMLPVGCFCQCHSSYYINLSHVSVLTRTEACMDNGVSFPVSKRQAAATAKQYFAFLSR